MQLPLFHRRRGSWRGVAGVAPLLAIVAALSTPAGSHAEGGAPRRVLLAQVEDPAREGAPEQQSAPAEEAEPREAESQAGEGEASDFPPSDVEVMRVRGRGIGAIETEVPSSITQFDAATIEALGAQDISDLSRVTPNVNIVQPGATQATFFVRGIGLSDFSSNAAGAVTIFQDDVSINAPAIQTGQLYDVEGVDIVRGPQGTGPYRNASAGAIRVRSRRPTGNYSAQLRSSLGRYDTKGDKGARNAMIQDYEGALEMPIVEDSLSSRFAFRFRDAEPYKKNGCGNAIPFDQRLPRPRLVNPPYPIDDPRAQMCGERGDFSYPRLSLSTIPVGLPRAVNDEHNWAARGTLRFQPPDTEMEFFLNAHGSRLDQDSTLGQAIGTDPLQGFGAGAVRFGGAASSGYVDSDVREEFDVVCGARTPSGGCTNPSPQVEIAKRVARRPLDIRPYRGDYNRVGQTTRDAWGGFVSAEAKPFGDTKLFALLSYDQYDRFSDSDTDFTPDLLFEIVQSDDAWQMYHELRLEGELEAEPFEWQLGGYYLGEHLDNDGTIFLFANREIQILQTYSQGIDSFGVWGEFGWEFADDFTLEGGVRFNWERKVFDFRRIQTSPFDDDTSKQDATWQTPTGQIILTYHIDEDVAAYARYSRGFKAGHFNALAGENLTNPPADEEYNDSWEAGLRGAWLDRRVSLATAFFYYRYENYQVFLFTDSADAATPPVLEILNAKQAENFGIEVEGTFLPLRGWAPRLVEGLRVSGNFSWLHGEYIDFVASRFFQIGSGGGPVPIPVDYSGKRLQNAPEYKVSATAEWTFDLGRFGYLIPRYDVNWSDDVFFDPNEGRGSVDPTGGPALVEYGVGQPQYFLHNVRLAYRTPTGNVEVAGWIRNVEDRVYKNFAFDASRFTGIVINFPGEPRTLGVDVTFAF